MQQIGLKRKILREKTEKNLGTKRLNKNEYPTLESRTHRARASGIGRA